MGVLVLLAAWMAIFTGALHFDLAVKARESSPGGIGLAGGFGLADARTLLAARAPHVRVAAPEVVEEIQDQEPESDATRMRR